MADRVIQRNDTAARWQSINPILATGEIGIEIDGAKGYKIGDGKTRWNDLPYPANPTNVVQELGDDENAVLSQRATTEKLSELDIQTNITEGLSQIKFRAGIINSSLNWDMSNENNVHIAIPIKSGDEVKIIGYTVHSVLRTYNAVNGISAVFSEDANFNTRLAVNNPTYTMPSDAKYLVINRNKSGDGLSGIIINGYDLSTSILSSIVEIGNNVQKLTESEKKTNYDGMSGGFWSFTAKDLKVRTGHINSSNKWDTSNENTHIVIPVSPDDVISFEGGQVWAVVCDYKTAISDDSPLFSNISPYNERLVSTSGEFIMPSDARFIIVEKFYSGADHTPSAIYVNGVNIFKTVASYINELETEVDELDAVYTKLGGVINLSDGMDNLVLFDGIINSSNKWDLSQTDNKHFIVPIESGDTVSFIGGRIFAVLTSYEKPLNGATPAFSSNASYSSRVELERNKGYVMPSDAKYLMVEYTYTNLPTSLLGVVINGFEITLPLSKRRPQKDILYDTTHIPIFDGYIDGANKWSLTNYGKHYIIPVSPNDEVIVNGGQIIAVLSDYREVINGDTPSFSKVAGFTGRITDYGKKTLLMPSDAKYLMVVINWGTSPAYPTSISINGHDVFIPIYKSLGYLNKGFSQKGYRREVNPITGTPFTPATEQEEGKSILDFNPDIEFFNKLNQMKRIPRKGNTIYYGNTPLVLAHFSDIHVDSVELSRIMEFCEHHDSMIDDILFTGDATQEKFNDDFAWWNNGGCSNVLFTIGNHECYNDALDALVLKTDVYNKFIAPNVANWGVVQPSGAENGKNYYYKDYSVNNIRLVVIDIMYWDSEQKSWLEDTLMSAKSLGLAVIAACHYPPSKLKNFDTPFNTLSEIECQAFDTIYGMGDKTSEPVDVVQSFIDNGGSFVTWLAGHGHDDWCGTMLKYPKQVCIIVTSAACNYQNIYDSTERVRGTKSQDAFNLVGVDTYNQIIKVVRVGADYDCYMRKKDTMCIKYGNEPYLLY